MKMSLRSSIKGLYAITPDELDTSVLLSNARSALKGGAEVLQYRNKRADAKLRSSQALALRLLCSEFGVTFIVNDDASLAKLVDADGVHLGGADGSVTTTRTLLGAAKLIGVSCYNCQVLARQAEQDGADYVAFGAFFQSGVKPEAVVASMNLLTQARQELRLPIVAIGGITPTNATQLIKAGADALAVISAVFAADDIEQAARQFSILVDR